jgi:hypothetical protein
MPLPWHVVHVKEPMPSQLTHFDTSDSPLPITTVTVPAPVQNLHTSGKSTRRSELSKSSRWFSKEFVGRQYIWVSLDESWTTDTICQFDLQGK